MNQNGPVFVTDEDRAKIVRIADAMFTQQGELAQVPRMAAGVVVDGALVAFTGRQATPSSLFRIASMTKSFTAAAVLALRDEGLVQLDAPVATFAPEYRSLVGPTTDAPLPTLRSLLTMSSGLATDDPWGDRHLDISDEELDAVVQGDPCFGEHPGTAFEYSNLGYAILGRVIHRVSGQRPQTFITGRFLEPLGMAHTVWEASQAPEGTDVVVGTRDDHCTPETIPLDGSLATMGGLWSTVADLARWVGFITDADPPRDDDDSPLLKRSSRREMQRMHTFHQPMSHLSPDGARVVQTGAYGMGLLIHHEETLGEIAGHSGGLPGYGSNMRWVKGTGFGVIALGNATYAPMAAATRRVLDAMAAAKIVRAPRPEPTPSLVEAGTALLALLCEWSDERARALFADNVEPDGPFSERRDRCSELLARHGSLRLARVEATSRSAGEVFAHSPSGEVAISFSLAPVRGSRIQKYELPAD